MPTSPKPELAGVPDCPHGAIGQSEAAGRGLGTVIDFSVNGNPLGQPAAVRAALAAAPTDRYPDNGSPRLRAAIAHQTGVGPERVVVGNGSAEIIWLLAAAYLRPGDPVLVVGPTFGEYARAAAIHGGAPLEARARREDEFRPNLPAIAERIEVERPRLAFLCNPNNPTGAYLRRPDVEGVLRACRYGLLVVDEAYLSFVSEADSLVDLLDEGVVLLRSMTKDYALAGLRLGYALAAPEVIAALEKARMPWAVNAPAEAAGLAALGDPDHLERSRRTCAEVKEYLWSELRSLGLEVVPSAANFLLVRVGNAAGLRSALLARGICVRDCASFGLSEHIRVGLRPLPDCRRLVAALREVINDS